MQLSAYISTITPSNLEIRPRSTPHGIVNHSQDEPKWWEKCVYKEWCDSPTLSPSEPITWYIHTGPLGGCLEGWKEDELPGPEGEDEGGDRDKEEGKEEEERGEQWEWEKDADKMREKIQAFMKTYELNKLQRLGNNGWPLNGKIGATQMAEMLGVDGGNLARFLRAKGERVGLRSRVMEVGVRWFRELEKEKRKKQDPGSAESPLEPPIETSAGADTSKKRPAEDEPNGHSLKRACISPSQSLPDPPSDSIPTPTSHITDFTPTLPSISHRSTLPRPPHLPYSTPAFHFLPSTPCPIPLSRIRLPLESQDAVPIFDHCDILRAKVNSFLMYHPSMSTGDFARLLSAQIHGKPRGGKTETDGRGREIGTVTATDLRAFLRRKGPANGVETKLVYAAYVFFEKLRISENRGKGVVRMEMEDVWGPKGMERKPIEKYVSLVPRDVKLMDG